VKVLSGGTLQKPDLVLALLTMAKTLTAPRTFPFRLRATGTWLRAGGDEITMISGSLNAVSLLVGFLMFSAARRTDQPPARPRPHG